MLQVLFSRQLARIRFVDRIAAAILLISVAAGVAATQQIAGQSSGSHARKHHLRPIPTGLGPTQIALLRMFPPSGVGTNTYYWLVVKRSDYARNSPPTELQFMVGSPDPKTAIFTERTSDYFLYAMLPQGDISSLVATVWETGTREAMKIFLLQKDKVSLVFEAASREIPEIVWDGAAILVSQGYRMEGNSIWPTETKIYLWNTRDHVYKLLETVPYAKRYDAVARIVRNAEGPK